MLQGLLCRTVLVLSIAALPLAAVDWRPIDPADLALKAPRVEKDASAEALFWEVRVKDEIVPGDAHAELWHYLRLKIFNDKGREHATVKLYYWNKVHLSDIAGRTVKPDGSVFEMKKDAIFDKEIVRASGVKVKAKTFVVPNVEPGDIVEYRWKEVRQDQVSNYMRLHLQRDIPIETVRYVVKPLQVSWLPYAMRVMYFQASVQQKFHPVGNGFYSIEFNNMPAFHEERHMPPEDYVRSSIMLYYAPEQNVTPDKYWSDFGRHLYTSSKERMKANGAVRDAAAQATSGASTDDAKLRQIYAFCRTKIRNTADRDADVTAEDLDDMKRNNTPADTLKQGIGNGGDIDYLFAALAQASGFDARVVRVVDSGLDKFGPLPPDKIFLPGQSIAVSVGGNWRFFDPGTPDLPYGMLRWQEEGEHALLPDPKDPQWILTSVTPVASNRESRFGHLKLSADGTLEGDLRTELSGQPAYLKRRLWSGHTKDEVEHLLEDSIKEYVSTADVENLSIENRDDLEKPLVYRMHLKISGYATRTGKRLLVQPALFHSNLSPRFADSTRVNPIFFDFAWSEDDRISIELPEGYTLDHAEVPAPINAGKAVHYEVKASVTGGKLFDYHRTFGIGEGGTTAFPAAAYPALKQVFDRVQESDNQSVMLKLKEVGAL